MLPHATRAGLAFTLLSLAACAVGEGGEPSDRRAAALADAPVPPPGFFPAPPPFDASGPAAVTIRAAFEDALSNQAKPLAHDGETYDVRKLSCTQLWVSAEGYQCQLEYRLHATDDYVAVDVPRASTAAERLFGALEGGGAKPWDDPRHGAYIDLTNGTVAPAHAAFEDRSSYFPPPEPNVSATGKAAQAVLDAFTTAGMHDENGMIFVVCGVQTRPAGCSYDFIRPDGFGTTVPGATLGPEASALLWTAVKDVGLAAGLRPDGDPNAEPTFFNARSFTWDGTTLRLYLVLSNRTPPPPPPTR